MDRGTIGLFSLLLGLVFLLGNFEITGAVVGAHPEELNTAAFFFIIIGILLILQNASGVEYDVPEIEDKDKNRMYVPKKEFDWKNENLFLKKG